VDVDLSVPDVDLDLDVVIVVVVVADATLAHPCRYPGMFGFQRLDAYQAATKFLAEAIRLASKVPRGQGDLVDQLRRAALSTPLNIAEGSGKFSRDARRYYTIARGSALECAAILDALVALGLFTDDDLEQGRSFLERLVSMLTGLIRE
jgi:four helix bundle protein